MNDRFSLLVATLDTPGGHMLMCLLVILVGAGFALLKIPKAEDLIIAGSGALFISMRGRGSENHDSGRLASPSDYLRDESDSK